MDNIHEILNYSVKHRASDVLISPEAATFFRINGELQLIPEIPVLAAPAIQALLYSLMTDDQIKKFERFHTIDFVFNLPNENTNFRVNLVKQANGVAAAIRLISNNILTLDEIGAPSVTKKLLELSHGLILITGPEGNGKSTTLSAMIDYINTHYCKHIITLEDPIEHKFKNVKSLIDQRQITREKEGYTDALRIALKGNPDVILVGELLDRETIRLALNAAETGKLVLTTLHSSSTKTAIRRMIDIFPNYEKGLIRAMVSSVIQGVMYQTLVPKINGGRIAVFEVLIGNYAARNLIRDDQLEQLDSIMELNRQYGMCTIKSSLQKLREDGIISKDEEQKEYQAQRDTITS